MRLTETLINDNNSGYHKNEFNKDNKALIIYIEFSLITLSTNNDLSHKTTFGSQEQL